MKKKYIALFIISSFIIGSLIFGVLTPHKMTHQEAKNFINCADINNVIMISRTNKIYANSDSLIKYTILNEAIHKMLLFDTTYTLILE